MTEVRGRDQRGALVGTGDEIGAIAEIQGQRDQGWVVGAAALHGDRDRRAETIGSLFWTAPETEMRKVPAPRRDTLIRALLAQILRPRHAKDLNSRRCLRRRRIWPNSEDCLVGPAGFEPATKAL